MNRILCIEDNVETSLILEHTLANHHVTLSKDLSSGKEALKYQNFDLVILDIELPDGDGFEFIRTNENKMKNIPVFFLSGKKDFSSKSTAFANGAEDFIEKPFDPRELKLRVDAKLKKLNQKKAEVEFIKLGKILFNILEQRLYFPDGNQPPIDLTSIEFKILHLLGRTPQKIFSRVDILDRVWGNSFSVSERSIDVHISNLRKKLAHSGVLIEAIIGSGYRISF